MTAISHKVLDKNMKPELYIDMTQKLIFIFLNQTNIVTFYSNFFLGAKLIDFFTFIYLSILLTVVLCRITRFLTSVVVIVTILF